MKRTFKKIIALLLVLATIAGTMVAGVHATEEETQSVETKTPDNTNWEFDASGGVLTVFGTGESFSLENASDYPWYQHKNETNKIVIANGITSVGDNAFYGFSASSVEIAETVEYIGNNAFGGCASLSDISVPESFTGFGENAFKGTAHYSDSANWTDGEYYIGSTLVEASTGMTAYAVKDGTVAVADFAIDSVYAENVFIPASVEYIGSRAFANASALKTITVDENNPNYSADKNGALYNKDKTKLIYVPSNAEGMQETFSATFMVNGEVFGDVIYGKEGEEITAPEAIPVKSGYKFLGWAVEGDTDIVTFPVTMSDENITFIAVFKEYLGEDDTLTIETKFYKQDSVTGEWVYTEYVEPGDRVKARVFINTTYYAVCGNVILFYDNRFFEDDLVESTQTNLKVNESASFVTSYETHLYMKHLSESGIISRMLSEGYISEEFAQTHNAYTVIFDLGNTTKLSSEEWLFEFDLRVREDATGEGFFGATEDTVMNYDRCFAYTDIPMIPEGRDVIDSTSLSNLYVNIETICNTVSQKSKVIFNANGGQFADGKEIYTVEGTAGETLVAPEEPFKTGYIFKGWSPELPDTICEGEQEYTAIWEQDLNYCRIQNVERITTDVYTPRNAQYNIKVMGTPEKIQFVNMAEQVSTIIFDRPLNATEGYVPDNLTKTGVVRIDAYNPSGKKVEFGSYETAYEIWTVVAKLDAGDYRVRAKVNADESGWESIDFAYNYIVDYMITGTYQNTSYSFDGRTGELIISGEGSMLNYYEGYSYIPWEEYKDYIISVTINEGITDIAGEAFSECYNLTSVDIPDSVTLIGSGAFFNCDSLANITIPDSVTKIKGQAFMDCDSIEEIIIPEGVTCIEFASFAVCINLSSVSLPEGVASIEDNAFEYCLSLSSISLPVSITTIEESAFLECPALTDVYYAGTEEQWNAINIDATENEDLLTATIHFAESETYTATFDANGGYFEDGTTTKVFDVNFGEPIPVPDVYVLEGYEFAGWYPDIPEVMPAQNIEFTAMYSAGDVSYIVETYTMGTDGTYGVPYVEIRTGTADSYVTVATNPAEGFYVAEDSKLSATVSPDGTTTFIIKYARNKYTVKYVVDGDYLIYEEECYHGAEISDLFGASYIWKHSDGSDVIFPLIATDNLTLYGEIPASAEPVWEINGDITVTEFEDYTVLSGFGGVPTEQQIAESFACNDYAYVSVTANENGLYSSGAKAEIYGTESGELLATYYIAVKGDVNGDGAVNPDDGYIIDSEIYRYTNWSKEKSDSFNPWKTVAADYDSSKIITSADFKGFGFVWYSVEVFNMNMKGEYGYSDYENYIAMNGENVTVKTSPAEGYSVDEEISVLNGTVSESGSTNFVVYYKRNYYTLTTVVDGVETSTDILFGSVIPAVETPVKEGYEFAGWSETIPVKMPAKNLTVTAKWNILNYEIVWIIDGMEISKEYYNYGETIIFPEEPVREGYIFNGWVIEETFESVPETMPAHHLTAVATFEACMCSIEWRIGDEIIIDYYHYGETIVPPEVPQKDGYIFVGWDNPVPEYMTGTNMTFTAVFEKEQEVMLVAAEGSTTVIDRQNMLIYGLKEKIRKNILLEKYIQVSGEGYIEVVISEDFDPYCGTGSVVNVYKKSGELVESFHIIIFGDINGDAYVNSYDAALAEDEYNWITDWSVEEIYLDGKYVKNPNYSPCKLFAADFNRDGVISRSEVSIIGDHTLGLISINQVTGGFIEYASVSTFSLRSFFGLTKEDKEEVLFIVPETVTEIGDYAFMNSRVTKAKIPASVTDISDTAFAEASALEYIDVNDENGSYTDINGILFTKDETKIVVYPKALTDTSYTLPLGTKEIGGYAFKGSALERIYLPLSLVSIGDYAFFGCDSLTYADIENNVTNIGKFAFYGCPLETADIPEKLETLGDYAFFGSRLDKIDISETVSKIGILAFGGNLLLEKITVDENNTAYTSDDNGVLFTKDTAELIQYPAAISQSEYTIPENVSVIADSAFAQSSDLGEITFSEGLTEIGDNAFNGCSSVRNIIVPESVEYIGDNAFSGCINVLRMKLDAKFIDSADFTEMNSLMDLQLTGDTSNVKIPAKLINFIAIGSYTDIQLSWSISNEINSSSYRIFRKSENENDYSLLAAITSRETQSYKDSSAAEDMSYSYVIVSVDKTTGIISPISEEAVAARREDTVAPTVTKITPETFTYISKTKTISVSATDDFMMSKVVLSYKPSDAEEWIVIGEDSVSPYSFAFDTTTIADGEIDVRAVAYDASGNESSPMVVYYSVDNTPPEKVTGLNAKVIRATAITLEWNDIKARDKACFVIQKKTSDSYETLSQYVTDLGYNVLGLEPETEYTFRVAAKDSQGNMGEYSDDFTVSTTADVTAPVITKIGPGKQRFNSSFVFTATAVDDDFAVKKIEVQTSVNRTDWKTVYSEEYSDYLSEKTISCGIDAAEYEDGSIFIRAVATDYAGNVSDTSDSAPLVENIIDRVAPEAPSGIKATSMDGYVLIEWSQGSEPDLDKYTLYRATEENGTYSKIYGPAAALNHYDKTVDRDTVYYYKVAVSDTAGNISDYSAIVSAKSLEDMENPVINSISPADGSFISEKTNKVSVLASDNNMLSEIVIEYKKGLLGSYDVLQSFADIGDYYKVVKATLPVSELEDGDTVYVRAYCSDITGLESGYSDAVKLTVDKTAPSTENLKAEHKNGVCTVTWDDCGEEDLAGFNVYRSVNGGSYTMIGSRAVSDTGSYSFDDAVTEGTYIYRIDTCDAYGNTESFFTENIIVEKIINLVAVITSKTTLEESVEYTFSSEASEADEEIISYYWDFGDGTFSNEKNPIKTYKAINTYTVTLKIADIKGNTSETSKTITVIERQIKGIAEVFVKDDSGNPVSGALVHLDIKQNNQNPKGTNRNGYVSFEAIAGAHVFSVYKDGYLPASANVIVSANNTSTVELTIVKQELITGEFEVHEMTFDEIVEAGIDTSNPANQQIYKVTVTLIYGKEKLPVTYIRNDREIISYEIKDKNGTADGTEGDVNQGSLGNLSKEISGIHYVPNKDNKEIIAVIQIPVTASYLKQFYSANLHIINNAAPGYEIVGCSATINVPSGLSIVQSTSISKVINGGSSSTANWILRGDKEGTYNLSASFSGTLNDFNMTVKATFKAKNPVVVYGPESVKLRIEVQQKIEEKLFFNVCLVNKRNVNVNCPEINVSDFSYNITEYYKQTLSTKNVPEEKIDKMRNRFLRMGLVSADGKATFYESDNPNKYHVKVLKPGETLIYEYCIDNVTEYEGTGCFEKAIVDCDDYYASSIEVVMLEEMSLGITEEQFIKEHLEFINSAKYQNADTMYPARVAESFKESFEDEWNKFLEFDYFTNYADIVLADYMLQSTNYSKMESGYSKLIKDTVENGYKTIASIICNDAWKSTVVKPEDLTQDKIQKILKGGLYESNEYELLEKFLSGVPKEVIKATFNTLYAVDVGASILEFGDNSIQKIRTAINYGSALDAYRNCNNEYFKKVFENAITNLGEDEGKMRRAMEEYIAYDNSSDFRAKIKNIFIGIDSASSILSNAVMKSLLSVYKDMYVAKLKVFTSTALHKLLPSLSAGSDFVISEITGGICIGFQLGTSISKLIANTQEVNMIISRLVYYSQLAAAFEKVQAARRDTFIQNPSYENALDFDSAFMSFKSAWLETAELSADLFKTKDHTLIAKFFARDKFKDSIADAVSIVSYIKQLYCHNVNHFVDTTSSKTAVVECPVDVYVYNSSGALVAKVSDTESIIKDDSVFVLSYDSKKFVSVPSTDDYNIKIVANESGSMNYTILEYAEENDNVRTVLFDDIALEKGDVFKGNIDPIIFTEKENYVLTKNEDAEILPAEEIVHTVTGVEVDNDIFKLQCGETVQINATVNPADADINTVKWTSYDESIATVTDEGLVTAIAPGTTHVKVVTDDGGHAAYCKVTVSPKTYKLTWIVDGVETTENLEEGTAITLPQPPVKAGYEFAGWCPEVPETMPASDMQFTAIFEEACPVLSVEATSENIKNCEYTDINVKTLDSVTRLKFITTDEKGKNTVLVYHETNSAVLITDNGDGTKTWSISMMFVNNGKGVIAQTYSVWYYKSDSVFYDQSDKSFTVNIIGEEDEVQTYEPYSVISVSAPETAKKSKFVSVTVTTTDDVTKVRFKDMSTGSTRTYLKTTTNVTCTDNGDGTLTWTIKYKFTVAGEQNLGVQCRGSKWSNITEKETVGIVIE